MSDLGTFVLFSKRDLVYEARHNYAELGVQLYDRMNRFSDLAQARQSGMHCFPGLLVSQELPADPDSNQEYVLAVRPDGKYAHTDYGGGRDILPSWDIRRVKRDSIESTLLALHKDKNQPRAYVVGIEQKLF